MGQKSLIRYKPDKLQGFSGVRQARNLKSQISNFRPPSFFDFSVAARTALITVATIGSTTAAGANPFDAYYQMCEFFRWVANSF
jgi:hypothetical protein